MMLARATITRRKVLTTSLLGSVSLLVSRASAEYRFDGIPWTPGTSPYPRGFDGARFFTEAERRSVDALVGRLIPTDDLGPGAREAGVVDFIDNQLAGSFGRGERWYMMGPFAEGLTTQGYQSELPPAELYRAAIAALDTYSGELFDASSFADLADDQQDSVLQQMERGEVAFEGVSATAFFALLQDNTIEGFFCDPVYGGNRDMVGWKLVGFPGVRYDYRDYLDHDGEEIAIDPVGLMGRAAWNVE